MGSKGLYAPSGGWGLARVEKRDALGGPAFCLRSPPRCGSSRALANGANGANGGAAFAAVFAAASPVLDARPPPGEGTARRRPRAVGGMERGAATVACTLLLAFAARLVPASGQGKHQPGGARLGEPDFPGRGRREEGSEAGQERGPRGGAAAAPPGALRLPSEGRVGAPLLCLPWN